MRSTIHSISHARWFRSLGAVATLAILTIAAPISATAQSMEHPAGHGASGSGAMKLHAVGENMHKKMGEMKMSGDVDHDFIMMMRSHHQAGVEMAEVEVANGKDKAAIAAAKKIIVAQKKEIAEFDKWLKNHPMK